MTNRQVQLTVLPEGNVTAENFALVDAEVGGPQDGEVLVRMRRLGLNAGLSNGSAGNNSKPRWKF